jgi:hypothetical protein
VYYTSLTDKYNNLQLLLRLSILDKFTLATFHFKQHKETSITGLHQFRRNESSRDLDSSLALLV